MTRFKTLATQISDRMIVLAKANIKAERGSDEELEIMIELEFLTTAFQKLLKVGTYS